MSTIVDVDTLLELVYSGLAAGLGLTVAFALLIYGLTRSGDMRRADRTIAAGAYAGVAVLALLACLALVALGLFVMTAK